MRTSLKILLPLILVALGAAIFMALVKSRPAPERREVSVPPPLVRSVTVARSPAALTIQSQGTVLPRTESTLVAEVAGRIVWTSPSFADGGAFRQGETLVKIDPRSFELAVEQAQAQVAQAQVRVTREKAEREIALAEWAEVGEGDPSPLVLREPQLAEAEALLAAARANLDAARLSLDRTRLVAPYPGRIRAKRADLGQFVAPGTPVAELFAVDYAEIPLPVQLDELAFLDLPTDGRRSGPAVTLSAEVAGKRQSWSGQVVRTSGEVDNTTRMYELIARVERPYRAAEGAAPLTVGLFVEAAIEGRSVDGVVALPRTALRADDRVLVIDDQNRLRFREVTVLRRAGEEVLISGGLADGERVCVSPLEAAVDGMRVRTGDEPVESSPEEAP